MEGTEGKDGASSAPGREAAAEARAARVCGGLKPDGGRERKEGKWGAESSLWVLEEGMAARRGGEQAERRAEHKC